MSKTHKILIGGSVEQIAQLANEQEYIVLTPSYASQESLREAVMDFYASAYTGLMLLCDASSFKEEQFGLFLKLLEATDFKGVIWFHNKPLSGYPFTIRSRCEIDVLYSFNLSMTRAYLRQRNKEGLLTQMSVMKHYPMDDAIEILSRKEQFTDLLLSLDSKERLWVYFEKIRNVDKYFLYLFYEWLSYNLIFSGSELDRCPFLREAKFLDYLKDLTFLFVPDDERARRAFIFMLGYKGYVA